MKRPPSVVRHLCGSVVDPSPLTGRYSPTCPVSRWAGSDRPRIGASSTFRCHTEGMAHPYWPLFDLRIVRRVSSCAYRPTKTSAVWLP